jgi:hypothetical protein
MGRPQPLGAIGRDQTETGADFQDDVARGQHRPDQPQLLPLVASLREGALDASRHVAAHPKPDPFDGDDGAAEYPVLVDHPTRELPEGFPGPGAPARRTHAPPLSSPIRDGSI